MKIDLLKPLNPWVLVAVHLVYAYFCVDFVVFWGATSLIFLVFPIGMCAVWYLLSIALCMSVENSMRCSRNLKSLSGDILVRWNE
jgi:predicted metal-binding membrane protein